MFMFRMPVVLLFVTWAVGLLTDYTGSGLIHILPMLGIALFLVGVVEKKAAQPAKAAEKMPEYGPQFQDRL
jgi:uncharacterized protein DUF5670